MTEARPYKVVYQIRVGGGGIEPHEVTVMAYTAEDAAFQVELRTSAVGIFSVEPSNTHTEVRETND